MTHSESSFAMVGDQVRIKRRTSRQAELDKLPSPKTRRWVISRKAKIVGAVRSGLLSIQEACERYCLSEEEFKSWTRLLDEHGMRGLRATKIQDYRDQVGE